MNKKYHYSIRVGAPIEYEMLYDFNENYLVDAQGQPLLHFTAVGGSPSRPWAEGNQGTSLSEENSLPYGIKVRWFSVVEDQFWEGNYQFDQAILQKLSDYTVNNVINRQTTSFTEYFQITVYVALNGLVFVWISSGGEKYLLAYFQARKVIEDDWDYFAESVLQRNITPSRENYIKECFNETHLSLITQAKQKVLEGELPNWKRLLLTYPWVLSVNEEFQLKDYWAWFVNGEKLFTYAVGNNTTVEQRPVPYFISFYIQDKKQLLNRFNITFDREEIINGFEKLSMMNSNDKMIYLHINVTPDFQYIYAYLIKGSSTLELTKIKVSLEDLYKGINVE